MRLPPNSIRTSRLVPLAVALLITACAGFEPFEHRNEREEGPRAGLISGESLLMGLLAACVALPVGILMAWVLIESVQRRAFGWTMQYRVTPAPLLLSVVLGLTAALLAGIYPAWRGGREAPAQQMRQD